MRIVQFEIASDCIINGVECVKGTYPVGNGSTEGKGMTDVLEVSNNIRGLNAESAEAQLRLAAQINYRLANKAMSRDERTALYDELDAILAKWLD